ncbi:hypothetical protein [Kiloniella laminariae]|uniref:hypothetical protein n=1 Tax=Kiloniella laminariae TaxID=454162 RepID=UPI0003681A27|nr:hypothetical protein [Kiloniella laminariae]
MKKSRLLLLACFLLGSYSFSAQATEVPQQRLDQILAMDPTDMAKSGAWTTAAYDRLMGYINSIEDPELRTLVLDMYDTPQSTVFNGTASADALRSAPATGGPGHHHYPGGLAVHLVEVIEIALGWLNTFDQVHGIRNSDRDLVIAQLALHDWSKVWYNWDVKTGTVVKPDWFPGSWGGKDGLAKWGWMGEHGAVVYAELLKRKAPEKLLFGAASTHFDPHWDVEVTNKDGKAEGFNPAMKEAAEYAGTAAPQLNPDKRMAEWFLSSYSDGSWSFSHYVAGKSAHKWIRSVAVDLGLKEESPEAARLAWFVLSRISDFKLYKIYQDADFSEDAVKEVIHSVIADSAAYEVK